MIIDRIPIATLVLPVLLGLSGPAWAQEESATASQATYQQGLTCEVIYSLVGETVDDTEGEAEYAAFLAETWHDYLSSKFPDGFEQRHEGDFMTVSDSLVESLNAMDDSTFDTAMDELLSTCESLETDPAFLG